jgi:hypothetical protein
LEQARAAFTIAVTRRRRIHRHRHRHRHRRHRRRCLRRCRRSSLSSPAPIYSNISIPAVFLSIPVITAVICSQ